MNEKLNTQDLIELLAERHGMSKKNADSFVKEFFLLIEESLEKDKYVKIRGLGTFKLIDVDSRESVNVNTGERFEIKGYTKISFTPEPTLKDVVNRPFSHFETVELNNNVLLEDAPIESETEEEEEGDSQIAEVKPEISQNLIEKSIKDVEKIAKTIVSPKNPEEKEYASTMKYFIAIVFFIVVLCGGGVLFMYYPDLMNKENAEPPIKETNEIVKTENRVAEPVVINGLDAEGDTVVIVEPINADTLTEMLAVANSEEVLPEKKEEKKEETKEEQTVSASTDLSSAEYTIVGTKATHTIERGETLYKISIHYYGTKKMWNYIVKHNPKIKNPDNIPFGTKIEIPQLTKKQ